MCFGILNYFLFKFALNYAVLMLELLKVSLPALEMLIAEDEPHQKRFEAYRLVHQLLKAW